MTTGYVVTIQAFTVADPVIDFGMNFAGSPIDPNVSLMISTPYTGAISATPYTLGGVRKHRDYQLRSPDGFGWEWKRLSERLNRGTTFRR